MTVQDFREAWRSLCKTNLSEICCILLLVEQHLLSYHVMISRSIILEARAVQRTTITVVPDNFTVSGKLICTNISTYTTQIFQVVCMFSNVFKLTFSRR